MKKLIYLTLMVTMLTFLMAASVLAVEPYYHGDFAADTTGCAKCHVTHAGTAAALLVYGANQTEFCYYCHNGFTKSPYDAEFGKIETGTGTMPSVAGGFAKTFDFDDPAKTYDETATGGGTAANFILNTSQHGVESYDSDEWVDGVQIPGGSNTVTGNFRCGSCHDPHAGGTYPAAGVMPRLLKSELYGTTFVPANHQDWTFSGVVASTTGEFKTKVLTGYGDNAGVWCAGCHDLFNQTAHDAGQVAEGTTSKYMHRVNFPIKAANVASVTNNSLTKIALSVGNDSLTCLSCHRAHGTASTVTDGTVFARAASYLTGDGTNTPSATQTSTVLLRDKNRNVCYDCHGAATKNTPTLQDP